MSRLATLTLVLLAVTAGCSLPGGETGMDLSAEEAPPGVSAESEQLTNATALTTAHQRELLESGFESDFRTNATVYQNGNVSQVARRQQTIVEPQRRAYVYRVENPAAVFDVWGNRSAEAVRARYGGQTQYQVTEKPARARVLTTSAVLERYLGAGTWNVTNVSRTSERTFVTLRTTDVPSEQYALPSNATDVRDYAAVAVVDERGRIHRLQVTASYTVQGTDGDLSLTYTLVRTDAPTVERPEWVATAYQRT